MRLDAPTPLRRQNRLHLAGKLHGDYQPNFGKGFDGMWLEAAGLKHEEFVEIVRPTVCDGQVADWVWKSVKSDEATKQSLTAAMFNYPKIDDEAGNERLRTRKAQAGLAHRDEIRCFVDFIDADEGRI